MRYYIESTLYRTIISIGNIESTPYRIITFIGDVSTSRSACLLHNEMKQHGFGRIPGLNIRSCALLNVYGTELVFEYSNY